MWYKTGARIHSHFDINPPLSTCSRRSQSNLRRLPRTPSPSSPLMGQFGTTQAVYIYEAIFAKQQAENWDPSDGDAVNLHGYSQAVAKAAVRSGLSRVLQRFLVAGELTLDVAVVHMYFFPKSHKSGTSHFC